MKILHLPAIMAAIALFIVFNSLSAQAEDSSLPYLSGSLGQAQEAAVASINSSDTSVSAADTLHYSSGRDDVESQSDDILSDDFQSDDVESQSDDVHPDGFQPEQAQSGTDHEEKGTWILPDSPLYALDVMLDRMSVGLTRGSQRKLVKSIDIAGERLREARLMAKKKDIVAVMKAQEEHGRLMDGISAIYDESGQSLQENPSISVMQRDLLMIQLELNVQAQELLRTHLAQIEDARTVIYGQLNDRTAGQQKDSFGRQGLEGFLGQASVLGIGLNNEQERLKILLERETGSDADQLKYEIKQQRNIIEKEKKRASEARKKAVDVWGEVLETTGRADLEIDDFQYAYMIGAGDRAYGSESYVDAYDYYRKGLSIAIDSRMELDSLSKNKPIKWIIISNDGVREVIDYEDAGSYVNDDASISESPDDGSQDDISQDDGFHEDGSQSDGSQDDGSQVSDAQQGDAQDDGSRKDNTRKEASPEDESEVASPDADVNDSAKVELPGSDL